MTVVRFLHLAGMAMFVGGQLMLVLVVAPEMRRTPDGEAMKRVARRFGIASAVALLLIVGTGIAMASKYSLWSNGTLQAKLMLLVLIAALTGLHVATPKTRGISIAILLVSLTVVYLGVRLTHG